MAKPAWRMYFNEQGNLCVDGIAPLSAYLRVLSEQVDLFLARLRACPRDADKAVLLTVPRTGRLEGPGLIWQNIVMLSMAATARTFPPLTPEQEKKKKKQKGVIGYQVVIPRDARPLTEALQQLSLSLLYNSDDTWVDRIPAETLRVIRAIRRELDHHRNLWERSEKAATPREDDLEENGQSLRECIRQALKESGKRMTTTPLLKAAAGGVNSHGKAVLAKMTKAGELTNRRKPPPPGYGLPEWG